MAYIIGVDEVGRGSWAGPVVACAFALSIDTKSKRRLPKLRDSKKLTPKIREEISKKLHTLASEGKVFFSIGSASVETIDRINIRQANREAMIEAFQGLFSKIPKEEISEILIDGNDKYVFPNIDPSQVKYIIKWDDKIREIQAASIIAKVYRDNLMAEYGKKFPEYGFEKHKWYGTKTHFIALQNLWVTEIHRQSYAPVKARKNLISLPDAL